MAAYAPRVGERVVEVGVERAGLVESVHVAWACVTAPDGSVAEAYPRAAADLPVFLRSGAKPLQALPSVTAGLPGRLGLGAQHLAVACASHVGSPRHVALVREILDAVGLGPAAVRTGILEPLGHAEAAQLRDRGEAPTPLHHNCSGNHALALAWCVEQGHPTDGYLEPTHPLQVAMRAAVVEAAGEAPEEGVDGCGMRAYRLPLAASARAFGRLAGGGLGAAGDEVARAMCAHPELVHGDGGPDTELMRAVPGLVAKLGAESFMGIGLADGRGIALKVLDGAWRALLPAAAALLEALGVIDATMQPVGSLARPTVTNVRGVAVGAVVPAVTSPANPTDSPWKPRPPGLQHRNESPL